MMSLAAEPCRGCDARTESLVRLGLSPGRWDYLVALEEVVGVPVRIVSIGPERDQVIRRD